MDPFDRSTYGASAQQAVTTAQARETAIAACYTQGLMLLAFLEALETHLSHEEALTLAPQGWRAA